MQIRADGKVKIGIIHLLLSIRRRHDNHVFNCVLFSPMKAAEPLFTSADAPEEVVGHVNTLNGLFRSFRGKESYIMCRMTDIEKRVVFIETDGKVQTIVVPNCFERD